MRPDCQVPGARSYKDQGPLAEAGRSRGGAQGLGGRVLFSPERGPRLPGKGRWTGAGRGSVEDTAQGVYAGQRLEEDQELGVGAPGTHLGEQEPEAGGCGSRMREKAGTGRVDRSCLQEELPVSEE